MEASKIIGDVVDKIEQSGVELDINYGDKKLQDGAKLSPTEVRSFLFAKKYYFLPPSSFV